MGAFPSGQWGQTVNLLLNASVVRIHQLPPKRTRNLGCGFFCAGAGRIRTGRPSADGKKQSCGLFFRPRLANPPAPTKKLWQEYCRSFFLWCTAQNRQRRSPIFKVRFIEMSNRFRAVGFPRSRRPWSGSCPSRKIRNRAQNCSGHLQSGWKTGIIATVTCLSSSAG